MSTSINIDSMLATVAVLAGEESNNNKPNAAIAKPSWLAVKGELTPSNGFAIAAGCVKTARQILDALRLAKAQAADKSEWINRQMQRADADTTGVHTDKVYQVRDPEGGISFKRHTNKEGSGALASKRKTPPTPRQAAEQSRINEPSGYSPDGTEYGHWLEEAQEELERIEAAITNGERMITEVVEWIEAYNDELNLTIVMGHTVEKDIIGNEFRRPKHVKLDRDTLPYAIANQKEFISTQRANS